MIPFCNYYLTFMSNQNDFVINFFGIFIDNFYFFITFFMLLLTLFLREFQPAMASVPNDSSLSSD